MLKLIQLAVKRVRDLEAENAGLRDDMAGFRAQAHGLQEEVLTFQRWAASLMSEQVNELEDALNPPGPGTVVQFADVQRAANPPAPRAGIDLDWGPDLPGITLHAAAPSGSRSSMTGPTDGRFTILVYPFGRFSDLAAFQTALQEIPGAHDVRVRRFAEGTLEVSVTYDGIVPLVDAIRGSTFPLDNVSMDDPGIILVRVRNRDAA